MGKLLVKFRERSLLINRAIQTKGRLPLSKYVIKCHFIPLSTTPVPFYCYDDQSDSLSLVGHLQRFNRSLLEAAMNNIVFGHGDSYINLICKDIGGKIQVKIIDITSFFKKSRWKVTCFNNDQEYTFDLCDTSAITIFGKLSFNCLNQNFIIENNAIGFQPKLKNCENAVVAECSRSIPPKQNIYITTFEPAFAKFNIYQITALFFLFYLRFA